MCFGLHNDASIKDGQLAHVNRDAEDSRLENLAFLCLQHHDQYDTRRSQSKGFTEDELLEYRAKLYENFNTEKPPPVAEANLFSEYKNLVPEKWRHIFEDALEFYTYPHRTQSAVLITLEGAKSIRSIAEKIPPNDLGWTQSIIEGAVNKGWLQSSAKLPDTFEATVRAKVLVEVLAELPEAVKDAAARKIWHSD